ncbi:hypothetical protein [Ornithinibacillus californiensis]|uniref:hypothetical protein n=1 Tax=Ornithinibacillus californiensis TaxID=161536 RepID=UPI00064DE708|nr:hypothetical protein [Ornithinibacillus californiensis]
MEKRNFVIVTLVICLMVSTYFNYQSYKTKSNYESYLSQVLSNEVAMLASNVFNARDILDQSMEDMQISKAELDYLAVVLNGIAMGLQEIDQINIHLNFVELNNNGKTFVRVNSQFSQYITNDLISKRTNNPLSDSEEKIRLTSEEINNLSKIYELLNEYSIIIDETVDGINNKGQLTDDYIRTNFVKKDDWILLLERINDVSNSTGGD